MSNELDINKLLDVRAGQCHALISSEAVEAVENKMLDLPQAKCSVKHYFGAGICIREVTIPAGVFSVGHHQNFKHMNHVVKGRVIMLNKDGTTKEVKAGDIFTCDPGRKIGFIIEEMVWHNIYPTDETDIEAIEAHFVTQSDGWQTKADDKAQLDYINRHYEREDFNSMTHELGYDDDAVFLPAVYESIKLPEGEHKIRISRSSIHGRGVFATSAFEINECIALVQVNEEPTFVFKYINHSFSPNAKLVTTDNRDVELIAIKDIRGCLGGDTGEEITINYRTLSNIRGALCQ